MAIQCRDLKREEAANPFTDVDRANRRAVLHDYRVFEELRAHDAFVEHRTQQPCGCLRALTPKEERGLHVLRNRGLIDTEDGDLLAGANTLAHHVLVERSRKNSRTLTDRGALREYRTAHNVDTDASNIEAFRQIMNWHGLQAQPVDDCVGAGECIVRGARVLRSGVERDEEIGRCKCVVHPHMRSLIVELGNVSARPLARTGAKGNG